MNKMPSSAKNTMDKSLGKIMKKKKNIDVLQENLFGGSTYCIMTS